MSDPILTTLYTLLVTVFENPILGPILVGTMRSITGWIYLKLKGETDTKFDPKQLAATMVKYSVAINAVSTIPQITPYAEGLVIIADILSSWAKKLQGVVF